MPGAGQRERDKGSSRRTRRRCDPGPRRLDGARSLVDLTLLVGLDLGREPGDGVVTVANPLEDVAHQPELHVRDDLSLIEVAPGP
jgi:hypothetical protein